MAFGTEIYVDPSIAADSGAGTIGDPFGDLEYAIEQTTQSASGTRINIKAGTDEVLAAPLNTAFADTGTTAAWTPSIANPVVIQGYTAVAGDLGAFGISGGGAVGIVTGGSINGLWLLDGRLHNTGSADVLDLNDNCGVIRMEIDNSTGSGVLMDIDGIMSQCYVHNIGGAGAASTSGGLIELSLFENGVNSFSVAIVGESGSWMSRNIVSVSGSTDGIRIGNESRCIGNSVWSNGGTGQGILALDGQRANECTNNVVEGFSGTGGIGYDLDGAGSDCGRYGGNSAYNNETDFTATEFDIVLDDLGGNEVLTASPFTSPSTGNFSPVDTGSVKEGRVPAAIGTGR